MDQNLEFQIYLEKMLERPRSLFIQKRLYSKVNFVPYMCKGKKFVKKNFSKMLTLGCMANVKSYEF